MPLISLSTVAIILHKHSLKQTAQQKSVNRFFHLEVNSK